MRCGSKQDTIALLLHTRRHGHARVVERSEKFDSIEKQQD